MTTRLILARRDLTPMQRVVLAALHEHADDAGRVTMTQTEIGIRCGSAHPVVLRRALAALQAAGALCVERRGAKTRPQILRLLDAPQTA